ncbi:MAG TPA: hypothetical protein DCS48_09755 [Desulfovibrio sp.]|nr:hypothetical protein [Desulfovibrio sp.]
MISKLKRKAFRMTMLTLILFEINVLYGLVFVLSLLGAVTLNFSLPIKIILLVFAAASFFISCKSTYSNFEQLWLHRTLEQVFEGRKLERHSILSSQPSESKTESITNQLHDNGLTTDQYIATLEQKIESLDTKLAEKEEIINKSGWKKWYLAACSAMGDIIRENTVNSSSPVTIKRDAFFERIKSNYPDQNEKEFGSANREAWKCVPDTVKHTDGSS